MFFKPGDQYTRRDHNSTISQLVGMGAFRFVRNEFVDVEGEPDQLDVYYYLTPMPKKGLRLELLGKTAAVYDGSEINVNWQHRKIGRASCRERVCQYV